MEAKYSLLVNSLQKAQQTAAENQKKCEQAVYLLSEANKAIKMKDLQLESHSKTILELVKNEDGEIIDEEDH